VVVLKGAGTLIHDGRGAWLVSAGNPGMASGGMGDVLTGVIAGLLAQWSTAWRATRRPLPVNAGCWPATCSMPCGGG